MMGRILDKVSFYPLKFSVPKIATLIQGFDTKTKLANRSFLVFDFRSGRIERQTECPTESQKLKHDLLASLASNPLVTVAILELWAKLDKPLVKKKELTVMQTVVLRSRISVSTTVNDEHVQVRQSLHESRLIGGKLVKVLNEKSFD